MARARNIKPGFFINEDLVELPFSTRLLFIGLWTIADREGRLDDRPRKIKMAIFPADNVDVEQGLSELHGAGLILRYVVDNQAFIAIPGFEKHQNPHVNEQPSIIPAPELHDASTVDATPLTSSLNPSTLNPSTLNPERGDGETPPAPEPSDTLEHHPLISGINAVAGRYPPKEIWDDLTGQVGANVDQVKLKTCFTKWRARGFNPQNFQGWAVDWYLHGIPEINAMEKRSNGQQPKLTEREKSAQRGRAIRQIADEYERQGREELAREALLLGSDQDHHQDHLGG